MYDVLSELVSVFLCVARGVMLYLFYKDFCEVRFTRSCLYKYLIIPVWAVYLYVMGELWVVDMKGFDIIIKQIVNLLSLMIISFFIYRLRLRMLLFLSVMASAVSGICLVLASEISEAFAAIYDHLADLTAYGDMSLEQFQHSIRIYTTIQVMIMTVLYVVIYAVCIYLIRRFYVEKHHELNTYELIFLISPALAGLFSSIMFRSIVFTIRDDMPISIYEYYPSLLIFQPIILILLLVVIISDVKLFQNLILSVRLENEQKLMEIELKQMKEHIIEIKNLYGDIRGIKHDMKNHISVMQGLLSEEKYPELSEYMLTLHDDVMSLFDTIATGDPVIDVLMGSKINEAKRLMPDIVIDTDRCMFSNIGSISSYDICILMGNAMDNAIRACYKEPKRFIAVKTKSYKNMLLIETDNPCTHKLVTDRSSDFPLSDREDDNGHGYGFNNMSHITDKYMGTLNYTVRDDIFTLNIMLRCDIVI